MQNNTETLVDDNGIEVLVNYDYEQSESQIEEGHGFHEVGKMVYTQLYSVEIVIDGFGIDILPLMSSNIMKLIINKLQYN